jgi:hypothetical protein
MYLEYQGNWTGEMESGMNQYVDTMEMVEAREAYGRWLKSEKTSNSDYSIVQNILTKNPNVGVFNGTKTFWGSDGTDYLNRHAGSMFLGDNGEILQHQKRYLVIVGDPGLNNGRGHNHNVGDNFDRVAETKREEFENEGNEAIIQRASSATDFANAMISNGMLDGVEYVGHGRNNMLFIGEQAGSDTNLDFSNYIHLSNANLNSDAYIKINACNAGSGDPPQMAQWLANLLGRTVGAFTGPSHFSDVNVDGSLPRGHAPQGPRLYIVGDPGTIYKEFRPELR